MSFTIDKDSATRIRERAYVLSERAGHPTGREMDYWLEAEAEVMRETTRSTVGQAPGTDRRVTTKPRTAAAKPRVRKPTAKKTARQSVKKTAIKSAKKTVKKSSKKNGQRD